MESIRQKQINYYLVDSYSVLLLSGVFISNTTLTIRKLRPEHRGKYRCSAQNLEGRGDSNDVMLDLRCKAQNSLFPKRISYFSFPL